jgi:hypothetical protein
MTYRVAVKGVWPDLTPAGNPRNVFDRCFENESDAREFFDAVEYPATMYWIDYSIGEISRKVLSKKSGAVITAE